MMKKGSWSHVTVVWSKGEVTCYYNGESKKLPLKTAWDTSRKLEMVFSGGSHQHRSYGLFDELRIYNRALSENEVTQLGAEDFYKTEKVIPVADAGMGYTAWLNHGKASFKMYGGYVDVGKNGKTSHGWAL